MNTLGLIVKKKVSFFPCYRKISMLSRDTLFNQICKLNLSFLSAQKSHFFSHDRHVSLLSSVEKHSRSSSSNSILSLSSQGESLILSHKRHVAILAKLKASLKSRISTITRVRIAGNLVYEKVVDELEYKKFFEYFQLPDTFQSWFIFIEIHLWLILVRTIPERHGREFRNSLVDAMWNDVEIRMGKLGPMKSSLKKRYLEDLVSQFQASLIAYDEGILSDDTVLAAAAWRTMYACKNIDPELLEKIVAYIRRQLAHLESENVETIIINGNISFLPIDTFLTQNK